MGTWLAASGQPAPRDWRLLDEAALPHATRPGEPVLVPLTAWLGQATWHGRDLAHTGVWLEGDADPAVLAAHLGVLGALAVRFASFRDGRGYSLARRLRLRHGYRGELLAVGDVLADQVLFMARCGFDGFALRADQDPATARQALAAFANAYQAGYALPAIAGDEAPR